LFKLTFQHENATSKRLVSPSAMQKQPSEGVSLFDRLGRPAHILAPMVDQSFLPFRVLARRYGAQLCYTPMINAGQFVKSVQYQREVLNDIGVAADRPLIAQFAGHDPMTLMDAARRVEYVVDAVDLNLGCPQGIARRGRYGAFLLEEEDLVVEIVRTLTSQLGVPVTCKIRLFQGQLDRTVRLCQNLEQAGCALLTVHGRTRHQNKETVGACDFGAISTIKASVQIPVFANGGIATFDDVEQCLALTGVDGVMSSEAALENPALFCKNRDAEGNYIDQDRLVREYLDLAEQYLPASVVTGKDHCPKCVKAHLFKMLYAGLQANHDLRDRVGSAIVFREYREIARELEARAWKQPLFHHSSYDFEESWYFRHRICKEAQKETWCQQDVQRLEKEEDAPWFPGLFDETA